jgi:putative FmdB family regulatory protein
MPTYQYECEKCAARFEVTRPIGLKAKASCPKCGAKTVHQVLSAFYAKTIKKS